MVPSFVTMKRLLLGLAIVATTAYAGAMIWLVSQETRLIFEPGRPLGDLRPKLPFEEVFIDAESGRQPAWIVRAQPPWTPRAGAVPEMRPWVIYLHGNDANIATRLNILHYEQLARLGLNVMAPEYRGYAGLQGIPTEAGLARDARDAYDYLRQQLHAGPQQIVIYGWSLGSAVAVHLAAQVDEAAVVLEGPPASIVDIGSQRYPFFPIRLLVRNPFESITRISRVGAPLLVLHSPEDTIIPIAEGRRLFEAALPPKAFVEVTGGHVYASEKDPRFFPSVAAFLRTHRVLP
jgi:fermentation-respiration switch protein FrsA (DUF1100 family)